MTAFSALFTVYLIAFIADKNWTLMICYFVSVSHFDLHFCVIKLGFDR
jgi:hypothetical protein